MKETQCKEAVKGKGMNETKDWDKIGKSWQKDDDKENQKNMHHTINGVFEREREREQMARHEIVQCSGKCIHE